MEFSLLTLLRVKTVPAFTTSNQLYHCLQNLFERVQKQDTALRSLRNSQLSIRLRYTQPEAEVVVDARQTPVQILYGKQPTTVILGIDLTADTFHQILLQELDLGTAITKKRILVTGPTIKALQLAELFQHLQRAYPFVVRELGI